MKMKIAVLSVLAVLALSALTGCDLLLGEPTSMMPTMTPTGTLTPEDTSIKPPAGKDNYIDSFYAQSVTFTDPNGKVVTGESDSEILNLLLSMTKNAEPSVYLGFSVDASRYYKAEFDGPAGPVTYRFYFSNDVKECYFRSGGGRYYFINTDACQEFMNSKYSEAAYVKSICPVLTIGETVIAPSSINWEYKKLNGEYLEATVKPNLSLGVSLGSLSASFIANFSITPTNLTAKVTDFSGNVLYEGKFADLCFEKFGSDELKIILDAEWSKDADIGGAGKAQYVINAKLTPAATFAFDKNEATPGDILILTCTSSAIDISKVSVTSNLKDDTYKAQFFADGDGYRALIPIPLEANRQILVYTVKFGGKTTTLEVALNPIGTTTKKISRVSEDTLKQIGIVANPYTKLFAEIKDTIYANSDLSKLYEYNNYRWAYNDTLRAVYGDTIVYTEDSTSTPYLSYDYSYVGDKYDKITAVSAGKVVYVGSTEYTGGLVVVDHGMGLFSWYWNLSEKNIKVKAGDEVAIGDEIGVNGGGGLTEVYNGTKVSVHVALTVYDVPVDLGLLIND